MKRHFDKGFIGILLVITMISLVGYAGAQDKTADNMDLVQEKISTDKKLFIATNMELTESEAKTFWPVYEAYQKELKLLRERDIKLIETFAAAYETMSDDVAMNLLNDSFSISSDHQNLNESYLPKFRKVLPDKKVARYFQLENKINAVVEYEMARRIPLVK
jgi:hypothetical protein